MWNVRCHPEQSVEGAKSLYETRQLVALVELGSKELDPGQVFRHPLERALKRRPVTPRLCPTLQNPLLAFLQRKEYISYGVFMSYDKQERMSTPEESNEVFNVKMQKSLDDARNGRITPWNAIYAKLSEAISEIKNGSQGADAEKFIKSLNF